MGVASAVSAGLGAGMGIYNMIAGANQKSAAKRALDSYQRQTLDNAYKNTQVSTLGADRQREEQARLAATQVEALQGSGTRGLIGGLGRVEAGSQELNAQIGANLDAQQKQIDQMRAEDDARIRSMQEARENADLAALSSQYQAGRQDMQMGMGQVIQGIGGAGSAIQGMKLQKAQIDALNSGKINTLTSKG